MGFIRKIFGGKLEATDIEQMKDEKDLKGLIMAMGDPFTDIRSQATDALGEIGDPQAVRGLIITAGDSDSVLSYKAEEAMVRIGEPGVGDLIEFLQSNLEGNLNSSELRAKEHVIGALGSIGDSQAVETLIKTLDDDYAPLRKASVISLGKIDDSRAIDALYGALRDENMDVRHAAKKELDKRGFG
jgi:HEAT repeat protein